MQKRPGFTLIEMVASVAIGSTMIGIAVGVLYLLFDLERDSREHLRTRTALSRLADRFRDDVHAATDLAKLETAANSDESQPAWRLRLASGELVEYRLRQAELFRTVRSDGTLRQQDSFPLPQDAAVSIEHAADPAPGIVSLRIVRSSTAGPPPGRSALRVVRIDAALAKDYRFVHTTKSQENDPD